MPDLIHLAAISGSLRAGSFNTALLRNLPDLAPPTLRFTIHSWAEVPVFNEDLEVGGAPESVQRLHAAIRSADGLVISTPEYNNGVPGGLKNALDWLSRGPMPHGLYEVPTAILGASDGVIGTARSQHALRQTLVALNAPTMPLPQVLVGQAHKKLDAEGRLTHESTREFIRGWLLEVERWMRRFPRSERSV